MIIRNETDADADAISGVIERAFATHPLSSHDEQLILLALRRARVLTVSLVAESEGMIVGHVAISPVTIEDNAPHWYGLGPVAVEPALQRHGIGSALTTAALDLLRSHGAAGCVVLGYPEYYRRFGFRSGGGLEYPGPPPDHFMALSFGPDVPRGRVSYHPAFTDEARAVALVAAR